MYVVIAFSSYIRSGSFREGGTGRKAIGTGVGSPHRGEPEPDQPLRGSSLSLRGGSWTPQASSVSGWVSGAVISRISALPGSMISTGSMIFVPSIFWSLRAVTSTRDSSDVAN